MPIQNSYARFNWRLLLATLLFVVTANQTYHLIQLLHTNQSDKTDLAELNHIRYRTTMGGVHPIVVRLPRYILTVDCAIQVLTD